MLPIFNAQQRREKQFNRALTTIQDEGATTAAKKKAAQTLVKLGQTKEGVANETAGLVPHQQELVKAAAIKGQFKQSKSRDAGARAEAYLETAQAYFSASVKRRDAGLDATSTIEAAARQIRKGGVERNKLSPDEALMMAEHHLARMEKARFGRVDSEDLKQAQLYVRAALKGRPLAQAPIFGTSTQEQVGSIKELIQLARNSIQSAAMTGDTHHPSSEVDTATKAKAALLSYREDLGRGGERRQANGKLPSYLVQRAVRDRPAAVTLQLLARAGVFGPEVANDPKTPKYEQRVVRKVLSAEVLVAKLDIAPETAAPLAALLSALHAETLPKPQPAPRSPGAMAFPGDTTFAGGRQPPTLLSRSATQRINAWLEGSQTREASTPASEGSIGSAAHETEHASTPGSSPRASAAPQAPAPEAARTAAAPARRGLFARWLQPRAEARPAADATPQAAQGETRSPPSPAALAIEPSGRRWLGLAPAASPSPGGGAAHPTGDTGASAARPGSIGGQATPPAAFDAFGGRPFGAAPAVGSPAPVVSVAAGNSGVVTQAPAPAPHGGAASTAPRSRSEAWRFSPEENQRIEQFVRRASARSTAPATTKADGSRIA